MTWSKDVTIWCDGDNCMEWARYSLSTVGATRKRARDDGWVYRGGEDRCPDCA